MRGRQRAILLSITPKNRIVYLKLQKLLFSVGISSEHNVTISEYLPFLFEGLWISSHWHTSSKSAGSFSPLLFFPLFFFLKLFFLMSLFTHPFLHALFFWALFSISSILFHLSWSLKAISKLPSVCYCCSPEICCFVAFVHRLCGFPFYWDL